MNRRPQILLGVTGGIAAYKSCELARLLIGDGAHVQVMMTRGAQEFVGPLTFESLTGQRVRTELFDREAEQAMSHIELARWADTVAIVPASAHCLARLATGMADDLLSTVCLATEAPLLVAPAMNTVMWDKPIVQEHVEALRTRGVHVLEPDLGAQACGEHGPGRLPEPARIKDEITSLLPDRPLRGIRAVVTAGPTREPIDPARFVSNYSTGHMGCAIGAALREAGASVVMVLGPVQARVPAGVRVVPVETAAQMRTATLAEADSCELLISAAAVADYRPHTVSPEKTARADGSRTLGLVPTTDILAELGARTSRPFLVGFAAETDDVEARARAKREAKGADLVVANRIGEGRGFGEGDTTLTVVDAQHSTTLGPGAKSVLARHLVRLIAARMPRTSSVVELHAQGRGSTAR